MTLKLREQTLVLEGGRRLSGSVEVGGSKNATLGAMAASLLVALPVTPALSYFLLPTSSAVTRFFGSLRSWNLNLPP
ncbi:MAG: hypothetical protein IIB78_11460 [Proteobacteria bacterium]|nr:hypothetical protein [Pseudomonadota bacterium]